MQGFQTFIATGIDLDVNQQRRVDVSLSVGAMEQKVEVMPRAIAVETTQRSSGQVIEQKKISDCR